MKTFLEYMSIKGDENVHIDEDGNLFDINDDAVVEKLNAYVGSIGMREYLNPEAAVNELRQKLMRIGLHFGDVQFTGAKKVNRSKRAVILQLKRAKVVINSVLDNILGKQIPAFDPLGCSCSLNH